MKLAQEQNANIKAEDLEQESDCLDTWFSSWLWPISLFDGIENPDNEEKFQEFCDMISDALQKKEQESRQLTRPIGSD